MSNKTIQKIDAQLARIDELVEKLLDGVDLSELSSYERLVVASRFMGLSQRAIAIRQTCQVERSENREGLLVAAFMRQMRGEAESGDALRILEEEPLQGEDGSSHG